jgi:hypothetical protein
MVWLTAVLLLLWSCCSCSQSQLDNHVVGYYSQQDDATDDSYASSMDDFPIDTAESHEIGQFFSWYGIGQYTNNVH